MATIVTRAGKGSPLTNTEMDTNLNNLDSELLLKAPTANPTFTGTVNGVTKAMVGLGSVDNTADAAKSVLYAATAAAVTGLPSTRPKFAVYLNTTRAAGALVQAKVLYDTVEFDTNTMFDLTNHYFKPTIAGYYIITWAVGLQPLASNTGLGYNTVLRKNSFIHRAGSSFNSVVSSNGNITSVGSAIVYANGTTDYFDVWGYVRGSTTGNILGGSYLTYMNGAMVP